jgi:hypothetical protein
MTDELNDPDFWRRRGQDVLAFVKRMPDVVSRTVLRRIAGDYEQIAKLVEARRLASSDD